MVTVSSHQPNFCPRASYFQKMAMSDVFVFLSHCKYNSSGYQNRFNDGNKYHGMAVGKQYEIVDKTYNNHERDWKRITAHFPLLHIFDNCITSSLDKTNKKIILEACKILDVRTQIEYDKPTALTGTDRLVDICKRHNATHYLSGPSGTKYLDMTAFESAGIEVIFQNEASMNTLPLYKLL